MKNRPPAALGVAVILIGLAAPATALAGMPSITLTEVATLRLQSISFFLAALLACSWGIQRLWNWLRADFPALPRLSFGKALGLMTLWGLLFVLVLTMISGARELMTPGAWRKQGWTSKLADAPDRPASADPRHEEARRRGLDHLRTALWDYAAGHGGAFPASLAESEALAEAWRVPDASGMHYLYVPGLVAGRGTTPLAYEPGVFGVDRLVLLTDRSIRTMSPGELERALMPGTP